MTNPLDIPAIAMTSNGTERTTVAKAIDNLANEQAIKRAARTCDACHKYQTHEQLKTVPTDDGGTQRLCPGCLDEDPAAKALYKAQWREALDTIDAAMSGTDYWFRDAGGFAKGEAIDRLAKSDPIGNFGKMSADYRRRWAKEDRVVRMVKAEQTRQETARIKKQTKKIRRKTEATELRKAAAEQSLANLLAEQASIAEQISELSRRTDVVYANAQRAYGAVAQQRESARIAELAKADQESAHWRDLAGQTVDPILRQAYLARAEGDFSDN